MEVLLQAEQTQKPQMKLARKIKKSENIVNLDVQELLDGYYSNVHTHTCTHIQ